MCDFWTVTIAVYKRQWVEDLLSAVPEREEAEAMIFRLMEARWNITKTSYLRQPDRLLEESQVQQMQEDLNRLKAGMPLQYLLGEAEFAGLTLKVGPQALIPRPETEEMLDLACKSMPNATTILDVGTGSGALALGAKNRLPKSKVLAIDISTEALTLAQENAELLQMEIDFRKVDFLSPASRNQLPIFDLILANLPYIPQPESATMEERVLRYEPHLALFVPESDPLCFYRALAQFAVDHLQFAAEVWMEVFPPLAEQVALLFEPLEGEVKRHFDLSGKERFVSYRR